jgi:D-3-phosphoglycerate dehydrogenase
MNRIVIADALEASGLEVLRGAGAEVLVVSAAERPRLPELVADADALVVRSATKVTRALLDAAKKLRVVGRAGVGVDNVDVEAATERGVLVVNAPTANLMSATEHTFALLLALARSVPAADASMKRGEWDRKSFVGVELQGKTLGIVGLGRIGQRVAARARAFEMRILAYDPFLDPSHASRLEVELLPLDELLGASDFVTLHTPLSKETRNLIDARRLALMKRQAMLVNCGRGGIVDETALLAALESGTIAGAGLDVFEEEPTPRHDLTRHPKVIATPHIGAQTREAQERIALETAKMVLAALAGDMPSAAVNLPFSLAGGRKTEPWLRLGERLGRLASGLAGGVVRRIEIAVHASDHANSAPAAVAVVKGALAQSLGDSVNLVNAGHLAAGRGIEIVRSSQPPASGYATIIRVRLAGGAETVDLAGTVFGDDDLRVVEFAGTPLEFRPTGHLLVLENRDRPGVVGKIGATLGASGINIADIHLARRPSGEAIAVLRLDEVPDAAALSALRALDVVSSVRFVSLS